MTIEERILDALDKDEGTEAFNLPARPRQASAALQRLRHKGLAEPERCPDGAWVWFAIDPVPKEDNHDETPSVPGLRGT